MRGYSHALSGAAVGGGWAELVQHAGWTGTVALAGFTAGMALLPDLDQCQASASRCLGFISGTVAHVVRAVSGGHRHATHSALGIAVFTGLAYLATVFRHDLAGEIGLGLLLVIAVSSALEALRLTDGHTADVVAIGVAAAVVWHGYGLALIPLAVLLGCSAHVAGDMLTREGCPVTWPLPAHWFLLPRPLRFETGHLAERFAVDPLLLAGIAFLIWRAIAPLMAG